MPIRSFVAITLGAVLATHAHAAVLCQKRSGTVVVRDTCRKKEAPIDLSRFGAVGPKGDTGAPGAPGVPGAAGSAVAYAHVSANGLLIAADSHNVTTASAAVGPGGAGAVCLTVATSTVHAAAVTLDVNESGGPTGRSIFVALRPGDVAAYVDGGNCPVGTNVVVYMLIGDNVPSTMEFYALFN